MFIVTYINYKFKILTFTQRAKSFVLNKDFEISQKLKTYLQTQRYKKFILKLNL